MIISYTVGWMLDPGHDKAIDFWKFSWATAVISLVTSGVSFDYQFPTERNRDGSLSQLGVSLDYRFPTGHNSYVDNS